MEGGVLNGHEGRQEEGRRQEDVAASLVRRLSAYATLTEAHQRYKPSHVFALFSGGHDSLTATSLAMEWGREAGVVVRAVHINTTIGIEETHQFVRDTCQRQEWPLIELYPPQGQDYETLILKWGFPGPAGHGVMYRMLKERALRRLVRDHKQGHGDHVMFVSGVRSQESVRRMRHVDRIQKDGAIIWAAAIHDWSKFDCLDHLGSAGIQLNPVVQTYHHSGECLCGAFARPGELDEIAMWYPETAAHIRDLEKKVEAAGHHACIWGARPPEVHRDQTVLFSRREMLCTSCAYDMEAAA